MRKQWRGFIAGFVAAVALLGLGNGALGATVGKTIEIFTGVNIYIDDVQLNPTDTKGNPVEAFIYNGTTYLPVRAVAEALGKVVQWEGKTSSVYLGKHTGEKPAVWLKDLDYFTGQEWEVHSTGKDNLGNIQENIISAMTYPGYRSNVYKINGQYSMISGTLFQNYDSRSTTYDSAKSTLEIYGDGELLYSATMNGGIEPIDFSVNIQGVLELKVYFETGGDNWVGYRAGIANCGLWT